MRPFKYRPPRVHTGELRTPVIFYEYQPNPGPEPGEQEKRILFRCFGSIEKVWMRDLEQAKANGTLTDITISIRDPQADYIPTNKHYVEIDMAEYRGKRFGIKDARPDPQNHRFIRIIAGVVE